MADEIQGQASMVGYINAFQLMSLVPLLTAPLAFLFVTRHRASGIGVDARSEQSHSALKR